MSGPSIEYDAYVEESEVPTGSSPDPGPYDFPQNNESYLDDGSYCTPYRHISNWFLARSGKANLRLPLPKSSSSVRGMVLYGELEPSNTTTKGALDEVPFRVRLDRLLTWLIDRSHTERGIWIETKAAWYKLKEPCSVPSAQPDGGTVSQEEVHTPMRAKFGLVSNLCDMLGERHRDTNVSMGEGEGPDWILKMHAGCTPKESYDHLLPNDSILNEFPHLNPDPFDLDLLKREAKFAHAQLKNFHKELGTKCAFMQGLRDMNNEWIRAKKEGETWATEEMDMESYKASALLAEARSGRTPWGGMIAGILEPNINGLELVRRLRMYSDVADSTGILANISSGTGEDNSKYESRTKSDCIGDDTNVDDAEADGGMDNDFGGMDSDLTDATHTGGSMAISLSTGDTNAGNSGTTRQSLGSCGRQKAITTSADLSNTGAKGICAGTVGSNNPDLSTTVCSPDEDCSDAEIEKLLAGFGASPASIINNNDEEGMNRGRGKGRGHSAHGKKGRQRGGAVKGNLMHRKRKRVAFAFDSNDRACVQNNLPILGTHDVKPRVSSHHGSDSINRETSPMHSMRLRKRPSPNSVKEKAQFDLHGAHSSLGSCDQSRSSMVSRNHLESSTANDVATNTQRMKSHSAGGRSETYFPVRRLKVVEDPKEGDYLSDFKLKERRKALEKYLTRSQGSKQEGCIAVREESLTDFLQNIVYEETVHCYYTMYVVVEALHNSSPQIILSLFSEPPLVASESGCRTIFVTWLKEAVRTMENRRRSRMGRAMLREMKEKKMKHTEEEIAVSILRLIMVCCGPKSCVKLCPITVKTQFGVDFVHIVDEMERFATAKCVTILSEACIIVKDYLIKILKMKNAQVRRRASQCMNFSLTANADPVQDSFACPRLAAVHKRKYLLGDSHLATVSCASNVLIHDFDQQKMRRQQIRAENAERMDLSKKLARLREENASLRGLNKRSADEENLSKPQQTSKSTAAPCSGRKKDGCYDPLYDSDVQRGGWHI